MSMMHPSVKVQIAPQSVPSTPSWLGEVAVLAHVLTQFGLLEAIEQRVRFARARFGHYDTIDFVVVLIGYAVSGEPTLKAFYARLLPFADPFMALFGRQFLPSRSALSRFLAALDQATVEALRTLFQADLVARTPFRLCRRLVGSFRPAVCRGRCRWHQTGCSPTSTSPPSIASVAHRRFDLVAAPGYTLSGRR